MAARILDSLQENAKISAGGLFIINKELLKNVINPFNRIKQIRNNQTKFSLQIFVSILLYLSVLIQFKQMEENKSIELQT